MVIALRGLLLVAQLKSKCKAGDQYSKGFWERDKWRILKASLWIEFPVLSVCTRRPLLYRSIKMEVWSNSFFRCYLLFFIPTLFERDWCVYGANVFINYITRSNKEGDIFIYYIIWANPIFVLRTCAKKV